MSQNDKNGALKILRIAFSLTMICVCVALAVSLSYALTRDRIEEKRIATERAAIAAVFGRDDIGYRALEGTPDDVTAVFEVTDADGNVFGYAVSVSPALAGTST